MTPQSIATAILIILYLITIVVTYSMAQNSRKIIGTQYWVIYMSLYGLLFFITSPFYLALNFVLGKSVVKNIEDLKEERKEFLDDVKLEVAQLPEPEEEVQNTANEDEEEEDEELRGIMDILTKNADE